LVLFHRIPIYSRRANVVMQSSAAVFQAERRISPLTGLTRKPKCTTTLKEASLWEESTPLENH
jgi:hypothetical protein